MIIQNYGLHWRRDGVNWGRPGAGNQGHLTGRLASRVNSPNVNFREQSGIYILQDGFKPVYIGQTGRGDQRLFSRLKAHQKNHLAERWDRFSWFGVYPVKKGVLDLKANVAKISTTIESILDHVEGVLMLVTEPPLNKQGARMGDADQYRQIPTSGSRAAADSLIEDEDEE